MNPETITIDNTKYIREDSASNKPEMADDYCVVRCDRAGVFAGTVVSMDGSNVEMENARCLWYWSGAASTLQLAVDGVSNPKDCKFTVRIPELSLTDAVAVMPCTLKAFNSIEGVKEWRL